MAKAKKISISQMDKVMSALGNNECSFEWHGLEVVVKSLLSFTEVLEIAEMVKSSCFADDTGDYLPEAKDFVTRAVLLEHYTNIRLPENLDHKYDLVYRTDIYEQVISRVNADQYEQLLIAIDDKLSVAADANIDQMRKQLEAAIRNMEGMIDATMKLYSGVSQDDLAKLTNALSEDGVLDQSKMMETYIEKRYGDVADTEAPAVEPMIKEVPLIEHSVED